jgi:probable rRNA maturation factor
LDSDVPLPKEVTEAALTSLATHVLRREGTAGEWQFGIRFVDDATMQQAHVDFMGIDVPTDIMTFPYEDEFGFGPVQGGDLLISAERAADNAAHAGWAQEQELFFLVCHGVLHLLGWDDATDEERTSMLARQAALMREWASAKAHEAPADR